MMKKNGKKRVFAIVLACLMTLALCSALAGCGGSGGGGGENGVVKVYSLGDYIDPDLVSRFEDETGISVILDTFDTNEEMYPVISKGTVDYDVICTSDYMIEKLVGEGLLAEIDYANVPNIENIDYDYVSLDETSFDWNTYAVPHTTGTLGIMYNSGDIPEGSITKWTDLWDGEKYSQQIVMPDSLRDNFAIALKAKGYSISTTDEGELSEAADYMTEQKPLVYSYANDSARDLAIGGSADIAVVWNGEVLYSQAENDALRFVIPEEGTEKFTDFWAIPAAAENKANGEAWINFMLKSDSALANFDYLTYSIPNKAVIDEVKGDDAKMAILFPGKEVLDKCEQLKTLGAESDDLYSEYWKKFKAE